MATQITERAAVLRTKDFLGRDVLDAGGNKIGTIKDLLLDRRSGTIKFLDVNLGVFKKQVVVPVSQLDWGEEAFVLRGWSARQIERLPPYDHSKPLTGEMLDELVWAYPTFYGDEPVEAVPTPAGEPQILPISQAKDFKVASDAPDLRGWNVFAADGERVGKVTDLLVDPAAMKVAYLDVDLHDDLFRLKDDRHVLIPTEAVDLKERGQDVWVREVGADELARLPAYGGGTVEPAVMRRVSSLFGGRRVPDVDATPIRRDSPSLAGDVPPLPRREPLDRRHDDTVFDDSTVVHDPQRQPSRLAADELPRRVEGDDALTHRHEDPVLRVDDELQADEAARLRAEELRRQAIERRDPRVG